MKFPAAVGALCCKDRDSPLETLETEGQMIQRVMPELMAMKNVMVLNDEGHHCYRRKPGDDYERPVDQRKTGKKRTKEQ